ncbi:hypothetical protein CERSUDRAFT_126157 [Gelatoporia subvermispora B]|uniref:Uncharacterized protein n=1 Tax=Ceriporiopsis subvermispora (strain B) TaxID=914234 RepID=M2QMP8_CERS8|nr:hypothetical protein CERSUDRAFT_126157 [Gelatoporia subvermispora B]
MQGNADSDHQASSPAPHDAGKPNGERSPTLDVAAAGDATELPDPRRIGAGTNTVNARVEQPRSALQNDGATPAPQAPQPQTENRRPVQRRRPTAQEEEQGAQVVEHIKRDVMPRLSNMRIYSVPDHQRFEFDVIFERVYKYAQEMEPNLLIFACFWKPDAIRHFVMMIVATRHQKQLLSSTHPHYTLNVTALQVMLKHFYVALEQLNNLIAVLYPELTQRQSQNDQLPPEHCAQPMGPSKVSPSQHLPTSAEQKPELNGQSGLQSLQGLDTARLNDLMRCTLAPAQELRARGTPEAVIKWLESNRMRVQRIILDTLYRVNPSYAPSTS